ncbi:Na(+)/H(+) antiporter subunit C [Micromonospora sp. KC606]|uniref:Na(+)/H(+) antiporter subunit C n=1 Tax=Micromonospora sp. KC606 TaxID=2530379 RepID=UPI00104F8EF0|nr:Na(+)/H(+) antiporter subunit C [Micromonospora sp. KC606]TDC80393.1 Na(+)/H(+) antiporter subunit C [Micromonospora sp. KC606]
MNPGGAGPTLVLVLAVGVLAASGVTLLLERSLTRILLGVILLGNGVNLLILLGGRSGGAPVVGTGPPGGFSDPLPQAMVLTAIVITFGFTAFVAAMAYRSWHLTGDDEVQDDLEDRQVVQVAGRDGIGSTDPGEEGPGGSEQADPGSARRRLRRPGGRP